MPNILTMMINIANTQLLSPTSNTYSNNRIQNNGASLESFIQDAIASSFDVSAQQRIQLHQAAMSYEGSANAMPDIIIRNGEAIEVKKVESITPSSLALNSSYPKQVLLRNDPKIATTATQADNGNWNSKEMFYIIGSKRNGEPISAIRIVHGRCYAAQDTTYKNALDDLTNAIGNCSHQNLSQTNEIARANGIDPLRITDLRVRGMWHIKAPNIVFNHIWQNNSQQGLILNAIMTEQQYLSYPLQERDLIQNILTVTQVAIQNPDNPMQNISAISITN